MKQFYVYIHKKPDGTPFYVGKGTGNRAYQFAKRTQWHKNIVEKYGKSNIAIEITNCIDESQAFELEKTYIKQLKTLGVELVNLTDGGEGCVGRIFTDEHRLKLSAAKKGKPLSEAHKQALRGKVMSEAHKQQIRLRQKGTKASDDTKRKLSAMRIGRRLSEECKQKISAKHVGKTLSAEHRSKLSEAHKGYKASEETKAKMRASHILRLQNKNNVI